MSNVEIQMSSTTTTSTTTRATAGATSSSTSVNKPFVASIKGILRVVEMILSLVAFICATVGRKNLKNIYRIPYSGVQGGSGWCMFVSMFSCLIFLLTYFLWLFYVFDKLTPKVPVRFMEFVMFVIFGGFYLIAGIVAASYGEFSTGLAAAAFFNFTMMVFCAVDSFFQYREWSASDEGPYSCCGNTSGTGSGSAAPAASAYPSTGHMSNVDPAAAKY